MEGRLGAESFEHEAPGAPRAPPPTVATRVPCGSPSLRRDDRARDHRRYQRGALKFLSSSPFFITLYSLFTIISLVLKTRAPLRAAPAAPCCLCFTRDEERSALTTCFVNENTRNVSNSSFLHPLRQLLPNEPITSGPIFAVKTSPSTLVTSAGACSHLTSAVNAGNASSTFSANRSSGEDSSSPRHSSSASSSGDPGVLRESVAVLALCRPDFIEIDDLARRVHGVAPASTEAPPPRREAAGRGTFPVHAQSVGDTKVE